MSKRKAYSKPFHKALSDLASSGHNDPDIAKMLVKAGFNVKRNTVFYWRTKNRIPQSLEIMFFVIALAEYDQRHKTFIKDLHEKIGEFDLNLADAISHFRNKGEIWPVISEFTGVADGTSRRWAKGKTPRLVRKLHGVRLPHAVPDNRRSKSITGEYAVETGIKDNIIYSLYPIFERNLDLIFWDDTANKAWKQLTGWCAEYEKRKARGEV